VSGRLLIARASNANFFKTGVMSGTLRLQFDLPPEALEKIAERVAEILGEGAGKLAAPIDRPYLNVSEAAEYLRASRQRVYDLLSCGRLRRYKDGSRVLVSRAELEAYLSQQDRPTPRNRQPPAEAAASERRCN
jgi:excisionase family DNA binding protein